MNQETAACTAQFDNPIRNFSVRLSPTPRGARLARLLATEQLRSWGLPLNPAEHVVAELAANAATHGRVPGRDFRLTLYVVAGTIRVKVTDTCGDRLPRPQSFAPDAESGRGLVLVDALAHRWGVVSGPPPRKTVWAEIDLLPPKHSGPFSGAPGDLPQETREGKNPTKPHPSRPPARRNGDRRANSLPRVNMPNSGGFGVGCLSYAQRDRTQPQTCGGHATAPAGTGIPVRGPDHRGRKELPDG